ncbi:MAG: hypothetical protein JST44_15775 [Cyanobacteria bacterium SZAS LIN-5]|nr:hypothetical protein [Cyanobacteria bacterium SZAS LIN-5]
MHFYKGLTTGFASAAIYSVALAVSFAGLQTGAQASNQAVSAASPKGNSVQAAIAQLEDKLYEHKYPNESEDQRLTRLEKFVFGAAQTGTPAERMQRLQSSFASEATAIDKVSQAGSQTQNSSGAPSSSSSSSSVGSSPVVTATPAFDGANYPRVTELEKDMLNATYVHEPLPQRLSRLEAKAFGKASNSTDLCARVDDLDEYAETHHIFKDHKDPLNSSTVGSASRPGIFSNSILSGRGFPGMYDAPDDDNDDSEPPKAPVNPFVNGVTGTDQKLSAMEEFVYGHNYATRPVQDRLERLEKRLVPYQHNLAQKDVTYRVNNIWNILSVANTFNSAPTAAHPDNTALVASAPAPAVRPISAQPVVTRSTASTPSQASSAPSTATHHSWLHQIGKSLGAVNVSNSSSSVPGVYPPDMAPRQ